MWVDYRTTSKVNMDGLGSVAVATRFVPSLSAGRINWALSILNPANRLRPKCFVTRRISDVTWIQEGYIR